LQAEFDAMDFRRKPGEAVANASGRMRIRAPVFEVGHERQEIDPLTPIVIVGA
jgi:hypothetical protein